MTTQYKVCATTRCPEIIEATRSHCPKHQRAREQHRGTATQRGYGHKHQALRKQWKPLVQAGRVTCWRCQQPIASDDQWDLGHDDNNREAYKGPEHRLCNTRAAGIKSQSNKIPGEK